MIINDGRLSATDMKLALWLLSTARGRASVDAFIDQIADAIGRSRRMVQYSQANLERCGYVTIERVREGSLNDANIYHLLAPLHAPAPRRRTASRREAMGVQKTPFHEERVSLDLPSELVAAREEGEKGAAGRGELAAPAGERAHPSPPRPPAAPQEARQVASATKTDANRGEPRPRAPP
jgi:hypothetical protein